jgi:hypothetical protein
MGLRALPEPKYVGLGMRSRAQVHGDAEVHTQLAGHVMPTMGVHPIKRTSCMDLSFLP